MPSQGASAPGMGDGLDAVFSAILAQITDGAVGNNPPMTAIPAVANDAGVPQVQPTAANAASDSTAAGTVDPLATTAAATDPNAALPVAKPASVTLPANDTKRVSAPANFNAAATVSLLEAQIASVPAPKAATPSAAESPRAAPKQTAKQAAPDDAADTSLLAAATAAPIPAPAAPVAPVAPTAPADESAALAAAAPSSAPPQMPPVGDADSDGSDDDDTPVSQASTASTAASASNDQSAAASSAGDFLADLKSNLGQTQAATNAAPPQNVQTPQFTAAPARKAAPAPASDASKATVSAAKSDANTTALTRLAASDQGAATGDDKSATTNVPSQPATPATADAAPAPSSAPLASMANDAANSAGALQQPLQATQAAPAATLHVAPQTASAHEAATSNLDSLGITIAAKSLDGLKHFDIRLDPPELGRVEVRLSVDDSGKAQASLSVDRPQTLQLLQNDASNLNRALKDAGLNLSDSGLSFSLRGQERQASDGGASQQRGRSLSVRAQLSIDAASQISSNAYAALSPDSAGVDIRV